MRFVVGAAATWSALFLGVDPGAVRLRYFVPCSEAEAEAAGWGSWGPEGITFWKHPGLDDDEMLGLHRPLNGFIAVRADWSAWRMARTAAHEMRHVWQTRMWGLCTNRMGSERARREADADLFAERAMPYIVQYVQQQCR